MKKTKQGGHHQPHRYQQQQQQHRQHGRHLGGRRGVEQGKALRREEGGGGEGGGARGRSGHTGFDWSDPTDADWLAFFRQTDPRRQLTAANALIEVLYEKETRWLESESVTAGERIRDLVHWARERLKPTIAPTARGARGRYSSDGDIDEEEENENENENEEKNNEHEGNDDDEEIDRDADDDTEDGAPESDDDSSNGRSSSNRESDGDQEYPVENRSAQQGVQKQVMSKKQSERIATVTALQVSALRLLAALAVTSGEQAYVVAHYDRASTTTVTAPPPPKIEWGRVVTTTLGAKHYKDKRTVMSDYAKGKKSNGEASCGLFALLESVISTASDLNVGCKATGNAAEKMHTDVQIAAIHTMTIVCLLMNDDKAVVDVCNIFASYFLVSPPDSIPHQFSADESDGEESNSDEDEDSETTDEDDAEGQSDEEDDEQLRSSPSDDSWWDEKPTLLTELQAETLRALEFLLAFAEDTAVLRFLDDHLDTLVALLLNTRLTQGASRVRMRAAALLGIYYQLLSDDDDTNSNAHGFKDRFLAVCRAKGRSKGGARVRGRERRSMDKHERAFFRDLVHELEEVARSNSRARDQESELHAQEGKQSRKKPTGVTSRKVKRQDVTTDPSRREVETLFADLADTRARALVPCTRLLSTPTAVLVGWRWRPVLSYIVKYFGNAMPVVMDRSDFRETIKKVIPSYLNGKILLVNKETLKGKDFQTKRYRRTAHKNRLVEDVYDRQLTDYGGYRGMHPSDAKKGRTIGRDLNSYCE